jgi:glycosyltransferase involved in cell wall biosynthesis
MTIETDSNHYQRGLELAEAGRYQEALACIEEHLRRAPEDAQALNDAGAVLHCLGRSVEAVHHLTRARNLQGDCAEIVWNLMEAYLVDGRADEAMQLFGDMERMHILNADVLNRTAKIFLDQDDRANAIEVLLRSLQLWPEQEILSPMIEVIRSQRPKVAFFCGPSEDAKSLADIHEFTKARFPVELFEGHNHDQMCQLMQWSDIAWFEWCADMALEASRLPKACKIIVRLHDYEAYDNWPTQVQWSNVDALIAVGNPFVKDRLLKQVPDIRNRTWIVTMPNGVNLDKFKFANRDRGKNLAFVGHLSMRKNPMFLLQCMQKLHYLDPGYKLFFAGTFQNPMLQQYIKHMVHALDLANAVFFDGWQEDMNAWLQDKHYIVSCSIGESQSMGLLEGMACGLKPVIHNFPGANEIFPPEFLFNISEEFCERILSGQYEPQRYRKFVEADYALIDQLRKINSIFTQLEAEMNLQKMEPIAGGAPDQGPTDIRLSPEMNTWTIENNGCTNPETV